MTHQEIQLVTLVLSLAGAVLALWQLLRALQTGVIRTRSGATYAKASHPRRYRMFVIFYAVCIVVLIGAAGSAAALLASGQR